MNLQGWLIYNTADAKRNRDYIAWMIHEAGLQNIHLQLMYRDSFAPGVLGQRLCLYYRGEPVKPPDLAVMRSIDPLFSLQMEGLGVRVFNPARVAAVCNNKARTHQLMASHGIPMLDTIFIRAGSFSTALIPFPLPWVIKTAGGRGGTQVYKADSIHQADAIASGLPAGDLVVQKVAPREGLDMRVFVVGQRVVGAVLRYSENDFRANYSLGGKSRLVSLSPDQQTCAGRIASLLDADMVGIDFLFDENDGLLLNEIEDVVGSRTLSLHSDINLLELFFYHVRQQMVKAGI